MQIVKTYQNLKGDKIIWMIVALLSIISVLAVYSSVGSMAYKLRGGNTEYFLIQHMVYVCLGVAAAYLSYQLHYMQYSRLAPLLLILSVPLLLYTLGYGTELNSARRWITIPWIDKSFQTSDFAKLALIIYIARSLAVKQEYIKDFRSAFLPIIVPVIIVCGLIAPADLSTAALLFVTCLMMMFIGRVSLRYVFVLVLAGVLLILFLIVVGKAFPEWVRLETWVSRLNQFMAFDDGAYQVMYSKKAIAEGGFFGLGPGNSVQRNFLPYAYADFIYAIICEEYGLIGGLLLLGLYLGLLFRCVAIVTQCPKAFGAILAMGLCLNIVIQAFANIAVSVHLLPVTGVTLPLVSMGGTSIIFTCISIGIILSVSRYVDEAKEQRLALNEMEIINEGAD
ncbi:MAG TPA: FtsW/RodA/SpoVE family cell cycle protein [Saprospiraceae bacterium]|nr:FtsW/RodA/SpoVE family cell cycle protein [Saprospiraceae bacterium]